jgi:sec-independent protein translocase protein TatA
MGSIGTGELIIVLVVLLLVFGGAKLPQLARSLGRAQKEFREGLAEEPDDAETESREAR